MLLIKILIMVILLFPALLLTSIIWILGGWTKGFDYMPNPIYALMSWVEK